MDILVIAIVTLPFEFEGRVRAKQAEEGLVELKTSVDTVIAIPNERLLQTVNLNTSIQDAFRMADDILRQAAQGISDLITKPGLVNLDFADVKSVMKGMGMAFMGTGIASGENRAVEAAEKAISSPLLVDTSIEGAQGVLINITGGKDMTLHEVSKASQLIRTLAAPEANIFFGTVIDESMKDTVKFTVIATGFDAPNKELDLADDEYIPPAPRKAQRPFPIHRDTPPISMEFRGGVPVWEPDAGDKKWDSFETPSFIRRTKHSSMRKTPNDFS
jgi:cell division protein FtsZ